MMEKIAKNMLNELSILESKYYELINLLDGELHTNARITYMKELELLKREIGYLKQLTRESHEPK